VGSGVGLVVGLGPAWAKESALALATGLALEWASASESDPARWVRDQRVLDIYDATTEPQRVTRIGRRKCVPGFVVAQRWALTSSASVAALGPSTVRAETGLVKGENRVAICCDQSGIARAATYR
jgi:hypothetical protein